MNELVNTETGEVIELTAEKIIIEHRQAQQGMQTAMEHAYFCGEMLNQQKKIEKAAGREWLAWLHLNCEEIPERTASGYMRLTSKLLKENKNDRQRVADAFANNSIGYESIREVLNNQPANYSSESEEWYTPAKYLDAVHQVFMPDLDPASNAFANQTVKAETYWTREDSEQKHTLDRDWFGRVFCNPPYGKDPEYGSLAGAFCNKAIAEYETGNVSECVLLVNSLHSQNWQAPLYDYAVCLVDHRIQFVSGEGTENKNPTMQNMFIYLGDNRAAFKAAFDPFGYVMVKL